MASSHDKMVKILWVRMSLTPMVAVLLFLDAQKDLSQRSISIGKMWADGLFIPLSVEQLTCPRSDRNDLRHCTRLGPCLLWKRRQYEH